MLHPDADGADGRCSPPPIGLLVLLWLGNGAPPPAAPAPQPRLRRRLRAPARRRGGQRGHRPEPAPPRRPHRRRVGLDGGSGPRRAVRRPDARRLRRHLPLGPQAVRQGHSTWCSAPCNGCCLLVGFLGMALGQLARRIRRRAVARRDLHRSAGVDVGQLRRALQRAAGCSSRSACCCSPATWPSRGLGPATCREDRAARRSLHGRPPSSGRPRRRRPRTTSTSLPEIRSDAPLAAWRDQQAAAAEGGRLMATPQLALPSGERRSDPSVTVYGVVVLGDLAARGHGHPGRGLPGDAVGHRGLAAQGRDPAGVLRQHPADHRRAGRGRRLVGPARGSAGATAVRRSPASRLAIFMDGAFINLLTYVARVEHLSPRQDAYAVVWYAARRLRHRRLRVGHRRDRRGAGPGRRRPGHQGRAGPRRGARRGTATFVALTWLVMYYLVHVVQ